MSRLLKNLIRDNIDLLKSKHIYLSIGNQWRVENSFRKNVLEVDSMLRATHSKRYYFRDNQGYSHNTTPAISIVDGFTQLFNAFWCGNQNLSDSVWNKKGDPETVVKMHYHQLSAWYGYEILPSVEDYQYYMGKVYIENKEFEKAEKCLNEGLGYYPKDADLHMYMGDLQSKTGRASLAIKNYKLALKFSRDPELVKEIESRLKYFRRSR
ncbi:hypothetical protein LJ707_09115 [Mucilaginibacter sp. UR6-1]|uniref:tetratricopeptide repeat protein n=1 Tax=Mucilaginibacter sp. UR6-1 TaxID=1435643 RepID=UPI001E448632|nr:hypothetical protein [Mucilaginibacter sp. UR6-1]MCC8409089.1 hypothetical protein [Mucilaginibacter sp. UR6-1]